MPPTCAGFLHGCNLARHLLADSFEQQRKPADFIPMQKCNAQQGLDLQGNSVEDDLSQAFGCQASTLLSPRSLC